jgi:hypothetical protein
MARVYGCHLSDARERHTAPVDIWRQIVDGRRWWRRPSGEELLTAARAKDGSFYIDRQDDVIHLDGTSEAGGSVGLFD